MHHMTANWVPVAIEERNMKCFGVWATLGSTGRWPEVVNMWELEGWSGLAANFDHEVQGEGAEDPELAKWWAQAAEFRRGGVDRILVPEPWSLTIDELIEGDISGEVYAHELATTAPGTDGPVSRSTRRGGLRDDGRVRRELRRRVPDRAAQRHRGCGAVGVPELRGVGCLRRKAWAGDSMSAWRARLIAMGVDVQRTLLVDAPLAPMRIGRQPAGEDRVPPTRSSSPEARMSGARIVCRPSRGPSGPLSGRPEARTSAHVSCATQAGARAALERRFLRRG